MSENKSIDNPQIRIINYIGARAQDENCVETLWKQTMGVVFNIQNSQLLTWSLPTEEIFQVRCQNWFVLNLLVVDFHSQLQECHYQSFPF